MAKTMASLQALPSSLLPRAWSRALIPFLFPFERLPRRLGKGRLYTGYVFHSVSTCKHIHRSGSCEKSRELPPKTKLWLANNVLRHENRLTARVCRRYRSAGERWRPEIRLCSQARVWASWTIQLPPLNLRYSLKWLSVFNNSDLIST